jgi:hypothetical protein
MNINIEIQNVKKIEDIKTIISEVKELVIGNENAIIEANELDDAINKVVNKVRNGIVDDIVNPFKSTYNTAVNTVKTGVTKVINDSKSVLEGMIGKIKEGFDKAVKEIKDWFAQLEKDMKAGFEKIGNFFKDFAARMTQMGDGLRDIFGGIGTEFTGLGEGLRLGFTNIGVLFKWVGEFVFSYIMCGVQYIQNLHRCIFFYVLDSVLHLTYIPVRIFLWIISIASNGNKAYELEEQLWKIIYDGDSYVYGLTGIHYAHYPKNIRDLCYNCRRMRVTALKNKVQEINNDFNVKMPNLLRKGVVEMQNGGDRFKGAFM